MITAVRVDASAHAANQRILVTLVDIFTKSVSKLKCTPSFLNQINNISGSFTNAQSVGVVDLETVVTCAHETAKCVGTASVLTKVVHVRTLVNIFQNDLQYFQVNTEDRLNKSHLE